MTKRTMRGFSLIELLIVVSIILIIAAIAIPGLLKARIAANQASAVESLRTMLTAESSYMTSFGSYSPTILALGSTSGCVPGTAPTTTQFCFIDQTLAAATTSTSGKSGYYFIYAVGSGNTSFTMNAEPMNPGQTGDIHYFADQSLVIRFNPSATASVTDAAIQ